MHIRYLKLLFVLLLSAMALVYVLQNFANLEQAHASVAYVMSGTGHEAYPSSFGPKPESALLAWFAVAAICLLELSCGLVMAKGAWDIWRARRADTDTFQASLKWAQIGCGLGIAVWFGLFGVIGAAFFQMWQTAVGSGSMNGAFQFTVYFTAALIFLNQPETTDPTQ